MVFAVAALAILCAGDAAMPEDSPARQGPESRAAVNVLDADDIAALNSAEAYFARDDWDAGMKKLVGVFERKPEMLIPQADGHTYISVWEYFHDRMIHLPPSATEAYRSKTDSLTRNFENAKAAMDVDALRLIARDHLFTQPGREALRFLAEHYYESRRFTEALACVARFEKYLAFEKNDSIRMAAMKLVCLARTGRVDELEAAAAALPGIVANEEIVWQGETMPFTEFVTRLKGIARSTERREDTGPLLPRRIAGMAEFPMKGAGFDGGAYPADETLDMTGLPEWQAETPFVETYPVLSGETLYLRLRSSLFALDVNDLSRPRWKAALGVVPAVLGDGKAPMAAVYAVAAGEGKVFATRADENGVTRLVCLDAATGKELWTSGGAAWMVSAPACIGGAVYVTGVVPRGELGDDYYLICLNARDGKIIYDTFLCTRIASLKGGEVLYPPAPAVMADGTIYVATNAGAVCAVDMMTGRMQWATLYDDRNSGAASPGANRFERALRREVSFAYGAPVVSGGALVVAPPEADALVAMDAHAGEALWTLDNSARRHAYLLGARGGAVILAGEKIAAFDLMSGKPLWAAEPDLGAGLDGMGFLTGDFIILPGDGIMTIIDARNGALVSRTAVGDLLKPPTPEQTSGFTGNLLPGEGKMFSVSRSRVAIYPSAKKSDN
jgi:outer membrane protein assembly factor BamB